MKILINLMKDEGVWGNGVWAEWIDEEDVDITGLQIPLSSPNHSGLPDVSESEDDLPWK